MRFIYDSKTEKYKKLIICKNCKYYREKYNDWDICELYNAPRFEKDFCSRAKRKDEYEYKNGKIQEVA